MRDVQANGVLCHNLKEVLKIMGTITVSKDRSLHRTAPTDGAVQIIVPEQ